MDEFPPFEIDALGALSRRLACAVFQVFPELAEQAIMYPSNETDGFSLEIAVPSPSGDDDRALCLWIDEHAGPTLFFGPNHAHGDIYDEDFVELVAWIGAILDDHLLILEEQDIPGEWTQWLDLREPDALEDYLTAPNNSGRVRLKSWSGKLDRDVSTDTL